MARNESSPPRLRLTDNELVLPDTLDPGRVYDVLFNGRHAWSLQPERDAVARDDGGTVRWPKKLRRFLVGQADVVVRDNLTGEIVAEGSHDFVGDVDTRVDITDADGAPLILDKYDRLVRPLAAEGEDTLAELLDQVEQLLADLRERCGVPAFICYGTLLGAVRDGQMIGHDNDIDLAYVSEHEYPVDVVREAYRVERDLLAAGWVVRRGMGARLNVRLRLRDGSVRFVDVFTSHWTEGTYYMPQDTGFDLPRSAILPLGTAQLSGRDLPAPADPDTLLAATYGEGWRVPDPSFKYATPRWLARRIFGWYGGLRGGRKGWEAFYRTHRRAVPKTPTEFAKWVRRNYESSAPIVDLGAGNARDGIWFAQGGRDVTAVDGAVGPLRGSANRPLTADLPITYEVLNFADTRQVIAFGTRLAHADEPVDLYGRFLLHALDASARENVLRVASLALRSGGRLFLEFRTTADAERPHHFKRPGRNFLDPAEVTAQIERHGGRVLHCAAGTRLASFADEDPHVCRIVATWERSSLAPARDHPSGAPSTTGA